MIIPPIPDASRSLAEQLNIETLRLRMTCLLKEDRGTAAARLSDKVAAETGRPMKDVIGAFELLTTQGHRLR